MEKEITKLEHSKVDVKVEVPAEDWAKAQKKAFDELAKNVQIKGFRKGHVPADLLKSRISTQEVYSRAINDIIQGIFEQVLDEEKFVLFARPSFDVSKVSDAELEVIFHLTLRPEVTLGAYKGLDVKREKVEVTDKDIDDAIAKLVEGSASLNLKEGPAANGDTLIIDFDGYVDGKQFDGGKADNYSLVLGSNTFIPGFEDQLVGHSAGEDVDVHVTFPTEYVPELAGKDAIFKVKIHEVKEKVLPELDEALIKDLNIDKVTNEAQLREYQRQTIAHSKEHEAEHHLFDAILEKIVADAKVDLSDEIIDSEIEGMKENFKNQLAQNGLTFEDYLKLVGKTEEDINGEMRDSAVKNLSNSLVLEKIAEVENIVVEDNEVEFELAKMADQYHMGIDEVREIVSRNMDSFKSQIRSRRITDYVIAQNEKK